MSRPEKAISAPPGVADCCDALGSTATEARCTEMPHAADAHSRHLAELKSLEDKFKLKLQERKASLEQAEEELLDADRHARIQLVQRRKQHQTEMRALAQTMEEELDARRATLEEENNAEIARWQTHLQAELDDKISAMQAAMKQQLDANKARVPDNTSAQVGVRRLSLLQLRILGFHDGMETVLCNTSSADCTSHPIQCRNPLLAILNCQRLTWILYVRLRTVFHR